MPRSLNEILAHAESLEDLSAEQQDEIADLFEDFDPKPEDRDRPMPAGLALQIAVLHRAAAEREIVEAVRAARHDHWTWGRVGDALGTSGEAARQRYGGLIVHDRHGVEERGPGGEIRTFAERL